MVDRYVSGRVDRISPEAPVPVVHVEEESAALGGAGNVAANVAALGAACSVVGVAGADESGRRLREELERVGVRTQGMVEASDRPTTVKTRVLARRQQVVRFDHESEADLPDDVAREVAGAVGALAADCDVLILEDYNKGVLVPTVIRSARLGSVTARLVLVLTLRW